MMLFENFSCVSSFRILSIHFRRERELEDKEKKEIETAVKKMSYENKIKELEETVSLSVHFFK